MEDRASPPTKRSLKEKSLPELMIDFTREVTDLIHAEIALIKVEVGRKAQMAGQGAGLIFGAVLALTMSMLTGTALVIIALANLVAPWLAALIVTCFWLLLTVPLALIGRSRFKKFASEPITSAKALKGRSR